MEGIGASVNETCPGEGNGGPKLAIIIGVTPGEGILPKFPFGWEG